MNPTSLLSFARCAVAALLLAMPLIGSAAQTTFATPEDAVEALLKALMANDEPALIKLFGDAHPGLVSTGDGAHDAQVRARTASQMQTYRWLADEGPDRRVLLLGPRAWPLPIPLVREGTAWRFATEEGIEEITNRRVGANERNAIAVLRGSLDAQREYAAVDRNGDGVLEYARRIGSTPGKRDGLYWSADPAKGEALSPFGPLIAGGESYMAMRTRGDPFQGYRFRILTRQGPGAAGGAYSYVINGRMIAGFAMLAYPDAYGDSGVMTFIVNHNGTLYQKDLGPKTAAIAAQISAFDPAGWTIVDD